MTTRSEEGPFFRESMRADDVVDIEQAEEQLHMVHGLSLVR